MSYKVKLENFEGPLDLLLFLIKKNEVDIYDIPIAEITQQYLEYIRLMRMLDLELAGDFILMAATLMRIKARMLLPSPQFEEEVEEVDPRQQLVQQLLEYKRFREVADALSEKEEEQRKIFPRSYFNFGFVHTVADRPQSVTFFDLIWAFNEALKRLPESSYHEIEPVAITVEEQIHFILNFLDQKEKFSFFDLISHVESKIVLVVTFFAILELIRRGKILVQQEQPFAEIWISKSPNSN